MMQISVTRANQAQNDKDKADLAIVGGGPACVALLYRLACAQPRAAIKRIDVFESRRRLGPGGAYEPPDNQLLMNTPVSHLDITGEPRHLTDWIAAHGLPQPIVSGALSLPRAEYGNYLHHVASLAIESLGRVKTQVTHRRHEIVDLREGGDGGFELTTAHGSTFQAHRVVLAMGDPAPSPDASLEGLPGYISAPHHFSQMAEIPRDADIIVLGAGASAVDCCLHLIRTREHRGFITLVSKSGQLPCVLSSQPLAPSVAYDNVLALLAQQRERIALAEVVKAVERDLGAWFGSSVSLSLKSSSRKTQARDFCRDVLRAAKGLPGAQDYIRSLRRVAPELWRRLTPRDRQRFDKVYRSQWNRYRHPIPLDTARPLMHMLRSAQVRIVKASRSPIFQCGEFIISNSDALNDSMRAPYLIQATGLELDASRDRSRLIGAILRRKIGGAHPRGASAWIKT